MNRLQTLLSNSTCAAAPGAQVVRHACPGRAVQIDPIKPTLKAPGSKCLKLGDEKPLSNFAFNFNLRRHALELDCVPTLAWGSLRNPKPKTLNPKP